MDSGESTECHGVMSYRCSQFLCLSIKYIAAGSGFIASTVVIKIKVRIMSGIAKEKASLAIPQ